MRIGIYELLLITGLCNKSAIRLCAVDLPERAKGAVKSNFGLWVYRELGQGPRGAREITCGEFIEPFSPARCSRKKLPSREFFATKGT